MRLRGAGSAKRRWRPLFAIGVWLQTALIALFVSGLGATPALAVQPVLTQEGTPDVTDNVWDKLACNVTLQIGGAIAVAHIGVILRVTHPESVDPGSVFDLTNVTAVQVLPPTAQHVALATYAPDNFGGIVNDFEINGTGASTSFSPGSSSPTQINQVAALQPTNSDTPNPVDPLINPDTANPAPGQWWTDNSVAASDARRHNVFSFGPIPTPGGSNPNYNLNAYGPSPGTGGGANPTDGTPDPFHIFPVTTTGAAGTSISIATGKPGTTIVMQDGTGTTETFAAHAEIFFHETNTPPAKYTVQLPVDCGLDTYPETGVTCPAQCGIIVPAPGYCTTRPSIAIPQGIPSGCYTSDDAAAPASAKPGISIPIVSPNVRAESAVSTSQYTLTSSNGTTWQDMDAANLSVLEKPTVNTTTLLSGNADLWTWQTGQNQDIGIFASDNGGADTLVAWKESGGSAGTFSPNAAFVQGLYSMTGGHTYVFKLKWKTSSAVPAGNQISAGAGPIGGLFSPTSLTSETFPSAPNFAVSTAQYSLTSSDGATWQDIDAVNLQTTLNAAANGTAVLGGNSDLWTWQTGQNQDIGIFVSDNGGADTLVSWKESGGSAGTFSPNAAFVKGTLPVVSGHSYVFKLKWKTSSAVPAGNKISAGAGPIAGAFSPTSLFAYVPSPGTNLATSVSTSQYSLTGSDGVTWQPIDAATNVTVAPAANIYGIVGANTDLWTWQSGQNQDVAVFVSDNGGADTLVAWKESGGSAGTFSPNAAFVQTRYPMQSGHSYVFKLKWKTSSAVPAGNKISAGAGPISGAFSPTRLTVELAN